MATILLLFKMCKEKRYANDFLDGKLYCNRVSWYIRNAVDKHEGEILLQSSKDLVIELNKYTIPPEDLVSASIRLDRVGNLNVFCMFAVHSGQFTRVSPDTIGEFKNQLEVPSACIDDFGKHAVVVRDVKEFYRRVDSAIDTAGYTRARGLVRYYDPESASITYSHELEIPFCKRDEFSYQKEFRIAMVTDSVGSEEVTVDLGGHIRDIAEYCRTEDIRTDVTLDVATDTLSIIMTTR